MRAEQPRFEREPSLLELLHGTSCGVFSQLPLERFERPPFERDLLLDCRQRSLGSLILALVDRPILCGHVKQPTRDLFALILHELMRLKRDI